jgi:hypothetical protein
MNQIANMILRRVMRQLINRGVDAGLKAATKGNAKPPSAGQRQNAPQQNTRQAKRAMRMLRRASKF